MSTNVKNLHALKILQYFITPMGKGFCLWLSVLTLKLLHIFAAGLKTQCQWLHKKALTHLHYDSRCARELWTSHSPTLSCSIQWLLSSLQILFQIYPIVLEMWWLQTFFLLYFLFLDYALFLLSMSLHLCLHCISLAMFWDKALISESH